MYLDSRSIIEARALMSMAMLHTEHCSTALFSDLIFSAEPFHVQAHKPENVPSYMPINTTIYGAADVLRQYR